jgi:hypothetical protein
VVVVREGVLTCDVSERRQLLFSDLHRLDTPRRTDVLRQGFRQVSSAGSNVSDALSMNVAQRCNDLRSPLPVVSAGEDVLGLRLGRRGQGKQHADDQEP